MGDTTTNYGLFKPAPEDSMADVKKNLTDNFTKLSTRAEPTIIANGGALPQAGNYELGDRVIRMKAAANPNDYSSSFILVAKSSTWGWHWRPVQQLLSPWVDIPSTALVDPVTWNIDGATTKLQLALDSQGMCHWRGRILYSATGPPQNTSITMFNDLPAGLRPSSDFMHTCAVSPINSGTGLTGYKGARIFIRASGATTVRFFNTSGQSSKSIWFNGFKYWVSEGFGYSA